MPDAIAIEALPPTGMITLRADLAAPEVAEAVRAATGHALPARRRIAGSLGDGAGWMAPDELLLHVPYAEAPDRTAALEAALAAHHHLAACVSDARAGFRLAGPSAREVLASGAPVDLHPAAFGPGDLRRTRLGQVAAAFWMPDPNPDPQPGTRPDGPGDGTEVFELVVFRSVAGFVHDWLRQAAAPGRLPGFLTPRRAR
jgi:sarcosine oxidase, subunit gamma